MGLNVGTTHLGTGGVRASSVVPPDTSTKTVTYKGGQVTYKGGRVTYTPKPMTYGVQPDTNGN